MNETGFSERAPVPQARHIEAPVNRMETEIRGSAPQILHVNTDASD